MNVLNATKIHLKLLTYKLCSFFFTKLKGTKLIDLFFKVYKLYSMNDRIPLKV